MAKTYSKFILLTLLLSLALATTTASAASTLFDATYEGKYGGLSIETDRRLIKLDNGHYRLESKASNFMGSLSEISVFSVDGEHWRPQEYTYKRRILGARTTETITFDWQSGIAHYTHSRKPERNHEHKLQPGLLDPALYLLRIQRDLARGNEIGNYRFIKRDAIRDYHIERAPSEELRVDGDAFTSIEIRRADAEDERQTYVWVLPELTFLIGKIVHLEDDGDAHQMELDSYKINHDQLKAFFAAPTPAQASPNTD